MAKKVAIGIDLGSTLSEVAVIENGKTVVIPNDEGSMTTPSVVCFKEETPIVGGRAKRQMLTAPKETVNIIKRFMGNTPEETKAAKKHVQYDVKSKGGKTYVHIKDRDYSPEEISSYIITKLKKTAEDYLGTTVTDAVITVPAFFSDAAKAATKQAGELAGLNVLRIISEPTSALLSSNIDKQKGGKYLVVDFGGATEDNSVADVSDGVVEIKASYGDVFLGGTDIDKKVSDWIVEQYKADTGVDLSNDPLAMVRVIEAAEKAKIELSNTSSTEINLPYITVTDNIPQHLMLTLNKAKFEQLIAPIVKKVIDCGKEAISKAKMEINELDGILLVGGSCRIPLVQEELIKTFGNKLIRSSNLDLAVAEGAAIQANILIGEGQSDILLLDVTPLGLGIETLGGVMTQIIEANTTIPCKKSQVFSTAEDNQSAVTINVLQGERPLASQNKSVGMFNLDGIAPARKGIPQIEVTFDINADGIISVSAMDKGTNKEQHITIENKNSLTPEEIERIKAEAKEYEAEDKKTKERIDNENKVESMSYQVDSLIQNYAEKPEVLTEDDKSYLNGKVAELKEMKERSDYSNLEKVLNEAQQRMYAIGAKAYQGANQGGQSNANQQDVMNQFNNMFGGGNSNPFGGGFNPSQPTNNNDVEDVG